MRRRIASTSPSAVRKCPRSTVEKTSRLSTVPGRFKDFVAMPDVPFNTYTLRGLNDSPPFLPDGRLLTLDDTVEFFNLVLGTGLTQDEKDALVAYLLTL